MIRMELFLESSIEIEDAGFVYSAGCLAIWPAELPEVIMARTSRDTGDNPDAIGVFDKERDLAQRFSLLTGIPVSRLQEQ